MPGLIRGGRAKCPNCGEHRFSDATGNGPEAEITCLNCNHVTTVEEAEKAATAEPKSGGSENRLDE